MTPRTIPELCRFQAGWCAKLGSPLYEYLLNRCAEEYEQGGLLRDLLEPHQAEPPGSALGLRLMGAVHRLVLERHAPELAKFYPSAGGAVALEPAWEAFRKTLQEHAIAVQQLICAPVQTNEVGRCGALLGGFLLIVRHSRLPLRLLEIGASAGLNLRWDCYRYTWKGGAWGDAESPVVLKDVFAGESPPFADTHVEIIERLGCDPNPIDATYHDGRLTLLSFIWPEQDPRRRLLEAAIRVARKVPCVVARARAADWLKTQLAETIPGATTVVYHSIVWQYLSHEERKEVEDCIAQAGSRATAEAPLAWLRMEPGKDSAEIRLAIFPGFSDQLIATSGYHGAQTTWLLEAPEEPREVRPR